MNGVHGLIVQQHAAKESKREPEHVRMMLQTLASHSLSKKVALIPQLIGVHGRIAQQLAMMSKQEQEHVLTIQQRLPMSQKLTRELAMFKTAVVNGDHGEIVLKRAAKEHKQRQKHASLV